MSVIFYIENSRLLLFGKPVTYYAIIPILAALLIIAASCFYAHKKKCDVSFVFRVTSVFWIFVAAAHQLLSHIPEIMLPFALLSSYIAAPVLFTLIGKIFKKEREMLQIGILGCSLYLGVSKTGCFLTGCCYGKHYDGIFSVTYGENSLCRIKGVPLFPTQLLVSILLLCVFLIMLIVFLKSQKKIYAVMLECASVFIYYSCVQLCDISANHMIINGVDYSIIIASAVLMAFVICGIIIISKKLRSEKHERKT